MRHRTIAFQSIERLIFRALELLLLAALVIALTAPPARGAALRRVQSGTTALNAGSTLVTATLSPAVDPSKAFLVFSLRGSVADPDHGTVSGQITNGNTLTFRRIGSVGVVTIEWYVADFATGVSVQRGTTTVNTISSNVPIAGVDLARSFPIVSYRCGPDSWFDDEDFARARLSSSTNLQLSFSAPPSANSVVEWQVIEYTGASVRTGDLTFTGASASVSPGAVDTGKSWLIYGYNPVSSGNPYPMTELLVRGLITNSTTLTFDRSAATGSVTLTWYLVEFTDGTLVQHGSQAFTTTSTQEDVAITSVGLGQAFAVAGYLMFGGRANTAGNNPGPGWVTADLTSGTNLRLQRAITGSATADIGWFVVSFPDALSGRVFEDANFSGTASDWDGGVNDLGVGNVDVELYDAGGAYVASTSTSPDGSFAFSDVPDGTYGVRARSVTIGDADSPPRGGINASVPGTWPYPYPEMTWAYGAARYGGASVTVDDAATGDDAGIGDTYVTVTVSGSALADVNLGFAYNLIVNNLDDGNADDARSRQGSLRQFIKNANAIGPAGNTTANTSQFRVPPVLLDAGGVAAFAPVITLPALSDASGGTALVGTTQTLNLGNTNPSGPEVAIDGSAFGAVTHGVTIRSAQNVVRGLTIHGFSVPGSSGIWITTPGSTLNTVAGCYLGTSIDGTADLGNSYGVNVTGGASTNTIGGSAALDRNVIGGNDLCGIRIDGAGTSDNAVLGNAIGIEAAGAAAIPNGVGILVESGASGTVIGRAGAGNTIAYNAGAGINLTGAATDGNFFGGNAIYENAELGIDLAPPGVGVGGGSNDDKPAPVLEAIVGGDGSAFAAFATCAAADTIDFYRVVNVAAPVVNADPSGYGEGYLHLGRCADGGACSGPYVVAGVDLDPDPGEVRATILPSAVVRGSLVTATATAAAGTSEFAANDTCAAITVVKRAFLIDGTPLASGAEVPAGVRFRYLLYVNNPGGAVNDLSLEDVLDPAFQYVAGSMRYSASIGACVDPACIAAEEAAILAAAVAGTAGTDAADVDIVSVSGTTISAGNQSAANAQLDIPADRVWALVFTVKMD